MALPDLPRHDSSGEPATPAEQLLGLLLAARRTLLALLATTLLTGGGLVILSPALLRLLQERLHQKLAFYTVAEPFLAHVKLGLFVAILALMPLYLTVLWRLLARPFGLTLRTRVAFTAATCLLFYAGAAFCGLVTLPYGISFLLGFGSEELVPTISVNKFVGFVALFIVAFGVIFQLPVFMIFCGKARLVSRQRFVAGRRYAVLVISILAALLTPTPDVVNMALMGVPLYLLYEIGILCMAVMGIR